MKNKAANSELDFAPNTVDWEKVSEKLSKIYGEWHMPDYEGVVSRFIPSTALLGNADVGLVSGGSSTEKIFYLAKGDFWSVNKMNGCGRETLTAVTFGGLTLRNVGTSESIVPALFYEKQDILHAAVITRLTLGDTPLDLKTWVSANKNIVVMEIVSKASKNAELELTVWGKADDPNMPVTVSADESVITTQRSTWNAIPENPASWTSKVAVSMKLIGADVCTATDDSAGKSMLRFTLTPGKTVYAVVGVGGGDRTYDYKGQLQKIDPAVQSKALIDAVMNFEDVQNLYQEHLEWWKQYWSSSYVDLTSENDNESLNIIERYYYGAQYILGSTVREGKLAPGLYGIWHTTDYPGWSSDYHLNYNFIAPFYGVCSSNRPQLQLPAAEALVNQIPQGSKNAENTNELRKLPPDSFGPEFIDNKIKEGKIGETDGIKGGVLFPVGVGPWGMEVEPGNYWRETMDAAYSIYPLLQYYDYTKDEVFLAQMLYPYLVKCITFLEAWIGNGDDLYTLYAAYNEGSWSKNPAIELAAYKNVLRHAIQCSEQLRCDEKRRENWKVLLCNMANQPTGVFNGKLAYSPAEKKWNGTEWVDFSDMSCCGNNILPLDCIIPGEVLGYFSSEEEQRIACNTIDVFGDGGWKSTNNFPRIFADAVRCRYPAEKVIEKLSWRITEELQSNLQIQDHGHGIEKSGAVEAVNNMLVIQHLGITKVFPNWLTDADASFECLRVPGAFVISAQYDGKAQSVKEGIKVTSLIGGKFEIVNPWKDAAVVRMENGVEVPVATEVVPNYPDEHTIVFSTDAGKTYYIFKEVV